MLGLTNGSTASLCRLLAETNQGERKRRRIRRRRTGKRGKKKLDTKEQRAALKVHISITRDNALESNGFGSLRSHRSLMEDQAIGHNSVKEEVRRSAKVFSVGQRMTIKCACLRYQVALSSCAPLTPPPPRSFETAITSQHTEGLGVGIQFHFFLTNDTLTVGKKKCWGPWTDFSVTKIKRVGLDKDRHFAFYFWTPMRALTNATPPPLRLCHDCFFSPEMS